MWLVASVKWGAVRFYSWNLSWPTFHPWIPAGAAAKQRQRLCKHLLATAPLSSLPPLVWMQSGLLELPVCPLTVHLLVHYICGSNHQPALRLRQVQRRGCASTSLCGSACRPATDPLIIIAIKHCFPNKTISLPLIVCQSLFLFTSGHSNPGTALTRGKKRMHG